MKKKSVRIITILFLCIAPIWMMLCKDIVFSQKENRNLAKFPKITWSAITSGEFMDDFETYLADQFPIRDWCVSLRTATLRAVGKRLINDVYIGKSGYLIAKESKVDDEKLKDLINNINLFSDKMENVDVNLMIIPNSSMIYEEKLPYGVKSTQNDTIDTIVNLLDKKVAFIDVSDYLLKYKNEDLYYKTDHHWNTKGAYRAFLKYAECMNIMPVEYDMYTVTGAFQGTQASNSGVYSTYENVNLCVPKNSVGKYVVRYVNEEKTTTTIFEKDKLKEKDKYQVFFGGNYAEIDISTTANTGKNLMIIKDSYANCFIPMLTPYYDKIIVIDPRYFYDDIYMIAKTNKINEVVFLYNVNSFVDDNSLSDVIAYK